MRRPFSRLTTSKLATSSAETQALVRTTLAITQIHVGVADNVLPPSGWLTVNIRSHPSACVTAWLCIPFGTCGQLAQPVAHWHTARASRAGVLRQDILTSLEETLINSGLKGLNVQVSAARKDTPACAARPVWGRPRTLTAMRGVAPGVLRS